MATINKIIKWRAFLDSDKVKVHGVALLKAVIEVREPKEKIRKKSLHGLNNSY